MARLSRRLTPLAAAALLAPLGAPAAAEALIGKVTRISIGRVFD